MPPQTRATLGDGTAFESMQRSMESLSVIQCHRSVFFLMADFRCSYARTPVPVLPADIEKGQLILTHLLKNQ
ncbi:hypothetical protein HanIR_Chr15g0779911 [Helianthus annuus]|nr:hypothetical protein HanIR_Chr15g0779911 [Helianthus annuus]